MRWRAPVVATQTGKGEHRRWVRVDARPGFDSRRLHNFGGKAVTTCVATNLQGADRIAGRVGRKVGEANP